MPGRLALFDNFDEHGNPLARPPTLLIDSEQLESGDALDKNFRAMAAEEIERFRREIVERTGSREQAENLSDQDLLREVMNTVGKPDRLGASIRCVVSVSMLTEGWDANTVTHVLGVRAFGAQLLCEQVVGRALRRQSYDLNEQDLFNVEYADVLGIPFDFTATPVVAPPQPPRQTVHVRAITPDRDACEINFPRVEGYRVELPEERLLVEFNDDHTLELTPALVGPSITKVQGIIGEGVDLTLVHTGDLRRSSLLFHLTKRLLETKWRDPDEEPKLHLFGQLKRITREWLDSHLVCKGGTYPAQLMYQELADVACERITRGIVLKLVGEKPVKAVLDPYNPDGSTSHVNFNTSKKTRWETDHRRCHINWAIVFLVVCRALSAVTGKAPGKREAAEARSRAVSRRSSRKPGFVVRGGRSRDTRPHTADLGSGDRGHGPMLSPDPCKSLAPPRVASREIPVDPGKSRDLFLIEDSERSGSTQGQGRGGLVSSISQDERAAWGRGIVSRARFGGPGLRRPRSTDPCQSSGPRWIEFRDGSLQSLLGMWPDCSPTGTLSPAAPGRSLSLPSPSASPTASTPRTPARGTGSMRPARSAMTPSPGRSGPPPFNPRTADRDSARPNSVTLPDSRCARTSRASRISRLVPGYPGSKSLIAVDPWRA